jgi:proteasome beta subunit
MGLPLFDVAGDPGPSFLSYLDASGISSRPIPRRRQPRRHHGSSLSMAEGGAVLVGDRQATGNYIANRDVRKIEAADRHTAIAISGSAAMGLEFIKIVPTLLRALREDDTAAR